MIADKKRDRRRKDGLVKVWEHQMTGALVKKRCGCRVDFINLNGIAMPSFSPHSAADVH